MLPTSNQFICKGTLEERGKKADIVYLPLEQGGNKNPNFHSLSVWRLICSWGSSTIQRPLARAHDDSSICSCIK